MEVNKKKLEEYSKKLYNGLRKQYKESGKYSGRTGSVRIQPTIRQHNTAIDNAKRRCVICGTKYDDAPLSFDIHHVDGNRENPDTSNLLLLCTGCHRRVHDSGGALMDKYKNEHPLQGKTGKGEPPKKPGEFINNFMR